MKDRTKYNKKLMFQVGIVIVPLYLFMLILVALTVYQTSVDSFLNAQNRRMHEQIDRIYENMLGVDGNYYSEEVDEWLLDRWEAHPEISESTLTKEEETMFYNKVWSSDELITVEWLEQQTDEMKDACVKIWADNMSTVVDVYKKRYAFDDLFIIDVTKPHEGFVTLYASRDNEAFTKGSTIPLNLSKHPAIRKLINEGVEAGSVVYERVHDFPDAGSNNYVCYRPITYNGKIRCVMGISYGWHRLRSSMARILGIALLVGVGGLLITLIVLLILLYRRAILPLDRIQKSISNYISTKDSKAVVEGLAGIRERNEFGALSGHLSEMVQEIDHYTEENITLATERERVSTELNLATRIQRSMLPTDFPVHEAFDLSASMDPAKEVGGDFYDFFFLDEDHLALVIADVSGKGIPASLFMMVSMDMIKNYTKTGIPLTEVLSLTNRNLLENKDSEMFVTVWLGIYEIPTGHVRAVNAGHEYPMIRPAGGSFTMMRDKHCFVVGGLDTAVFTEYEFDVEVGGTLFLYTDGAPEATNISEEILSTDGVLTALNNDPDASPEDLIRNVTEAIDAFAGEAPQFDDQTMLVLHRKK